MPCSAASAWICGSRRSNAAAGSASRRVCTATASPFSSMNASAASLRRSRPGSWPRKVERPCGGRGETIRRRVEDQRSKPYWPNRCSSRAGVADRVAHLVEAAEGERLPGRAAGDHRDRGDHLGEVDQHLPRVGVDVRLRRVVHDRRQGPVEVEADDGGGRGGDERGVPVFGLGERNSMAQPNHVRRRRRGVGRRSRGGSGGVGGEHDREPVAAHRTRSRASSGGCRGRGASTLAAALSRGG